MVQVFVKLIATGLVARDMDEAKDAFKLLMEAKADPNVKTEDGETASHAWFFCTMTNCRGEAYIAIVLLASPFLHSVAQSRRQCTAGVKCGFSKFVLGSQFSCFFGEVSRFRRPLATASRPTANQWKVRNHLSVQNL